MSNYDRNAAIPGAPADYTFAVDAGLRAYMRRVYNYMATGVRPTSLHPPGVEIGYTPVWLPAIPTLPAGTLRRGAVKRGVTSASGNSPRYAKPGANPKKYTR